MQKGIRRNKATLCAACAVALLALTLMTSGVSHAGFVPTLRLVPEQSSQDVANVQHELESKRLSEHLRSLGYNDEEIKERLTRPNEPRTPAQKPAAARSALWAQN